MLVVLYAVIRKNEKDVPYVWDDFHVLLLLGRTLVFGLRT